MTNLEAIEVLRTMYPKRTEMVNGRLQGGFNDYYCKEGKAITTAIESLEKQIPYSLKKQDSDTGICKCGVVTEIIDEPFYCKMTSTE